MQTRLEVFQSRRLGRCKITTVVFIPMATMTETLLVAKAASGLSFAQLASRSPSRAFQQGRNPGVHIDNGVGHRHRDQEPRCWPAEG